MKNLILTLFALLLYFTVPAQGNADHVRITGTVYDKANNRPVPGATVYLDNTSVYTVTGADGKFTLKTKQKLNTPLIIHHLSYNTLIIKNPFDHFTGEIYLEEKGYVLKEALIEGDKFTRAQKMKAFKEHFLGTTKAGKSCEITNEDDIRLYYNINDNTLTAKTDAPIVVNNKYLGYTIEFNLMEFEVMYKMYSLKHDAARQSFFAGTSLFIDREADSKKIKERRNDSYDRSSIHFFKHLINHSLDSSNFTIYNQSQQRITSGECFNISDTLSQKLVRIKPEAFTNFKAKEISLYSHRKKLDIRYKKRYPSAIYFKTDSLLIGVNGLLYNLHDVLYSGEMSRQKLGDMLPLDYEP